ncbi:SLC13 family permease [Bradyrhizobium betae]
MRAATVIALCVAAVWLAGRATGAPDGLVLAAALVLSTVCCWALGVLPEPATTLLFFLCAILLHVAPASVVFSGFASTAWWLMFGGAVTGVALRQTGPAQRLAAIIFRGRVGSYRQVIGTVALSAVGLAFLMPSTTGRVLLLMPIVLALADRLGFRAGLQRPHRHGADRGGGQLYAAHRHPAGQYPEQCAARRGEFAVWRQPKLRQLPVAAFSHSLAC